MAWTTPTLCEICVGMEVTAYEFKRVLISTLVPPVRGTEYEFGGVRLGRTPLCFEKKNLRAAVRYRSPPFRRAPRSTHFSRPLAGFFLAGPCSRGGR